MALLDSDIRKYMILSLETVIEDIKNHELPLGLSGYQYFAREGNFGKQSGHTRFWVASIAVSDYHSRIEKILDFYHSIL